MNLPQGLYSPGLWVAALIALAASLFQPAQQLLPDALARIPVSPILIAIVIGLLLAGIARTRPTWEPGLSLAAGPLLKLAVMLIGLRLSLGQAGSLGLYALPLVAAALISGLGLAWLLGRMFRVGTKLTALLAVGSAICGASAIAATAPALRPRAEETAYALACVALIGLAATIAYPWLLNLWLADGGQAGFVMGAAIHDTAQVTGAAILYEQTFNDPDVVASATVTKLLRNLSMLVVIPLVVFLASRGDPGNGSRPAFPLFILGFVALAGVRTAGDYLAGGHPAWDGFLSAASVASAFLFAMAMAAIGMGIRLTALRSIGIMPGVVAFLTAVGMGGVALAVVFLLG